MQMTALPLETMKFIVSNSGAAMCTCHHWVQWGVSLMAALPHAHAAIGDNMGFCLQMIQSMESKSADTED